MSDSSRTRESSDWLFENGAPDTTKVAQASWQNQGEPHLSRRALVRRVVTTFTLALAAIMPAAGFGAAPSHSEMGAVTMPIADTDRSFSIPGPSNKVSELTLNETTGPSVPVDPELKKALAQVSKETGEPLDLLIARHAGEDLFDETVNAFEAKFPGVIRFGGAAAEGSGESARWLLLNDEPTSEQVEVLSTYPLPLKVRFGDGPTAEEMSNFAELMQGQLSVTHLQYQGFGFVDGKTGVEILFSASETIGRDELKREAVAAIDRAIGTKEAVDVPFGIEFVEVAPAQAEEAITGGYSLWDRNNSQRLCTTGFTVSRSGDLGVVTAKHCNQDLNYRSTDHTLAPAIGAADAANGEIDLQFHRTLTSYGHVTTKRYQERAGDDVLVNAVEPIVQTDEGESRFHTGWASGAYVSGFLSGNINVCRVYNWSGGTPHESCGLVITTHHVSTGGDSGGPWYTAAFQNASGIHAAGSATDDWSAFTNISRVSINLDATVRTD